VSVVGADLFTLVTLKDLTSPCDRVLDPDACRLRTNPEFEILGAVVILDPIPVMNAFIG
jgi:hypothetical protein